MEEEKKVENSGSRVVNGVAVTFSNFLRKFKKNKIGPVNFNIYKGRTTALLGKSGSGKTVILSGLLGVTRRYTGDISFNDISRRSRKNFTVNKDIGVYVQMDFSSYDIKAITYVKMMAKIYGIPDKEIGDRVEKWMTFFGLWDAKDRNVKAYSWGMKNRMNLVLCFMKEPDVLILDEPGANLDSLWRKKILDLLNKYKKEGKTIIITVHNLDEIVDIIDDYIIIDNGNTVFAGTAEELNLYRKYKVVFSAPLDMNHLKQFLHSKKINTFKHDEKENSLILSVSSRLSISWLFVYLMKVGVPMLSFSKLPITIESIFKALDYTGE